MREWKCDDLGCEYEVAESSGYILLSLDDGEITKHTFHKKIKLSVILDSLQSIILPEDRKASLPKDEIHDSILNSGQNDFSHDENVYDDVSSGVHDKSSSDVPDEKKLYSIIKTEFLDPVPVSTHSDENIAPLASQKSVSSKDQKDNYSARTESRLEDMNQSVTSSSTVVSPVTAQALLNKLSTKPTSRPITLQKHIPQSSNTVKVRSHTSDPKTSRSTKYLPATSLSFASTARHLDQRRKDFVSSGKEIRNLIRQVKSTNSLPNLKNTQRLYSEKRPEFYRGKNGHMSTGANTSKVSASNYMSTLAVMKKQTTFKGVSIKQETIDCEVCHKKFRSRKEFTHHVRNRKFMRRAKKAYVCKPCSEKNGAVYGRFGFEAHFIVHNQVYHSSHGVRTQETPAGPVKKYRCPYCTYEAFCVETLNMHVRKHTEESPYKCCLCKTFVFNWESHAKTHNPSSSGTEPVPCTGRTKPLSFRCSRCDVRFLTNAELREHIQTHPIVCTYCSTSFKTRPALNRHLRLAHQNDALKCPICSKLFNEKSTYDNHMKNHRFRKTHPCPVCGLYVTRVSDHIRVHTDSPDSYSCDLCPKKFRTVYQLNFHRTLHSGEKQYQCDYCPRRFRLPATLRNHMKTHGEEKDYVCEICGKTTRTSYNLKIHKRIHSDHRPFPCTMCDQGFNYKASLKSHMKSRHSVDLDALSQPSAPTSGGQKQMEGETK